MQEKNTTKKFNASNYIDYDPRFYLSKADFESDGTLSYASFRFYDFDTGIQPDPTKTEKFLGYFAEEFYKIADCQNQPANCIGSFTLSTTEKQLRLKNLGNTTVKWPTESDPSYLNNYDQALITLTTTSPNKTQTDITFDQLSLALNRTLERQDVQEFLWTTSNGTLYFTPQAVPTQQPTPQPENKGWSANDIGLLFGAGTLGAIIAFQFVACGIAADRVYNGGRITNPIIGLCNAVKDAVSSWMGRNPGNDIEKGFEEKENQRQSQTNREQSEGLLGR
jgi:hypothetical protein